MAGPRESRSAVASSLDNRRKVRGLGALGFVELMMTMFGSMEDRTNEDGGERYYI
jgi:hypothetical protein